MVGIKTRFIKKELVECKCNKFTIESKLHLANCVELQKMAKAPPCLLNSATAEFKQLN